MINKNRQRKLLPIKLINSDGKPITIEISKGKHSELQKEIIEKFTSTNFVKEPIIVFVDDSGKNKYWDKKICEKLGIEINIHGKLPDVIIYDQAKDWIFLFEAFTTHGPIDEKRLKQLYDLFFPLREKLIFVTVFQSLSDFKKHADKLAFDTDVWIAELPTHMIHYNGDRFLGPRKFDN